MDDLSSLLGLATVSNTTGSSTQSVVHQVPYHLPLDQVQSQAQKLAKEVCQKYNELKDTASKFGANIEKRWVKNYRHENKREDVLREVWSGIPADRNIVATITPTLVTPDRQACFFPPINLADLKKDDMVMQFISSHAATEPSKLVYSVLEYTNVVHKDYQESDENKKYRICFRGNFNAQEYGKIVPVNAADLDYDMLPGIGLLVLEIQHHVYDFLTCLAADILKVDLSQLTGAGPFSVTSALEETEWPTLLAVSRSAPYQAATKMDLTGMATLVSAESQEKIHYLARIRKNPRHFLDLVRQQREILSPQALLKEPYKPSDNAAAINSLVNEAYCDIFFWSYIQNLLQRIQAHEESGAMYDASGALSDACTTLFQQLERWNEEYITRSTTSLRDGFFLKLTVDGPEKGLISSKYRATLERITEAKETLSSLTKELAIEETRDVRGMATIIADFQDIIDNDSDVMSRLDQFTLRRFEQIALAAELRRQIRLLAPLTEVWRKTDKTNADTEDEVVRKSFKWNTTCIKNNCHTHAIDPDDPKFVYPTHPISEEAQQQRASVLEIFDEKWSRLDQWTGMIKPAGSSKEVLEALAEAFVEVDFHAQRSNNGIDDQPTAEADDFGEEYEEPEDVPSTTAQANNPQDTLTKTSISEGSSITPDAPKRILQVTSGKKKEKTRGVAGPIEPQRQQWPQPQPQPPKDKVKVDRSAYHLLEIGLKTSKKNAPGEVKWNAVLHMMNSVGFSCRNTAAKMYAFAHRDPSVRPFSGHGPHPETDMKIGDFKRHIKRMQKVYPTWFMMDSFELKD